MNNDSLKRAGNSNNNNSSVSNLIYENGTIMGAITDRSSERSISCSLPEITISGSRNSLHRSRCAVDSYAAASTNEAAHAAERTALLQPTTQHADVDSDAEAELDADVQAAAEQQNEFEHLLLNRTTSDSNILESSIYSELAFPVSIGSGIGGGSTAATAQAVADLLNTSASSRQVGGAAGVAGAASGHSASKRTRRKHKSKTKCTATATPRGTTPVLGLGGTYPPHYTAIFLDHQHHHLSGAAANAMGQIASAAAASPFLNAAPVADANAYLQQQYHYYQQRPLMSGALAHHHHRSLLDSAVALTNADNSSNGVATPIAAGGIVAANSGITPPLRLSFRKWFSRPSLPFIIGILALGGVACTLGGIVLGSTGLIEHSTQYLSAALLMIGIGVSLLVISGAIWRLSLPDDTDECPCYRHMETCRNCNSPYCNNRLLPGSYLYPEFQHRPPPPSYLTSLNECAAMGLLFHPAAQAQQAAYSTLRMNTPPPLYRSTNSLSVFVPSSNSSAAITNLANAISASSNGAVTLSSVGNVQDHNAISSADADSLQAQPQPFTKEFNYLELD